MPETNRAARVAALFVCDIPPLDPRFRGDDESECGKKVLSIFGESHKWGGGSRD